MDGASSAIIAMKKAQLEAQIQDLKRLISQYRDKISYYNGQIRSADKSYESVTGFKSSVQKSQESFSDVNNIKSSTLEQVNAVSTNNTVAKKYYAGMKRILSGTGSKIASKLYSFLINKIGNEQTTLRNKSNDCSEKIDYYNRLINKAQRDIELKTQELQSL